MGVGFDAMDMANLLAVLAEAVGDEAARRIVDVLTEAGEKAVHALAEWASTVKAQQEPGAKWAAGDAPLIAQVGSEK